MSINKVKYISTKNGDNGTSKDYSNSIFSKSDILFEVLGCIDELSSFLGLTYHYIKYENIIHIQKDLQKINTIIATNPDSNNYKKIVLFREKDVKWVEVEMQNLLDIKPIEARLTLPGSEKSLNGAYFDYSRTLARKAERRLIEFSKKHKRIDLDFVKEYLNRLSDFLYILSCHF